MTKEEIVAALLDDMEMPYLQDWQARDIVDFVIKNYKPSLPSVLDEAAEEELDDVDENWQIDERGDGCTEPGYNQKQMLLMFKAGAEWMAGQGFVYEDKVYPTSYEHEPTEFCLDGGEEIRLLTEAVNNNILKQGDKVIIQIRKK